jgi:hypothetical protein
MAGGLNPETEEFHGVRGNGSRGESINNRGGWGACVQHSGICPFQTSRQIPNGILNMQHSPMSRDTGMTAGMEKQRCHDENRAGFCGQLNKRPGIPPFANLLRGQTPLKVTAGNHPKRSRILMAFIQMKSQGHDALEHFRRGLAVVLPRLDAPDIKTGNSINAACDGDGGILMPGNHPVGLRRFVE